MPPRSALYKIILIAVLLFVTRSFTFAQIKNTVSFDLYTCPIGNGINTVQDAIRKGCFETIHDNNVINLGTSTHPLLVKLVIRDSITVDDNEIQISNPNLDKITCYRNDGRSDSLAIEEVTPTRNRPVNDQNFIFPLSKSDSYQAIYFKIEAGEQVLVPIEINSHEIIRTKNKRRDNTVFFYLGVMLVMFLYNSFLFANTKDKNYFYYVLYILFVTLTQLTFHGFINKYLPESFNYVKVNSVYIFGAASGLTTLLFLANFLDTKKYLGKYNYIILTFIGIDVLAILFAIVKQYQLSYTLVNLNAGIGSLIVLIAAIYISFKGSRSAKFFLIAWSLFLASVIVFVLKDFGVIPYNSITRYVLLYGSAIEVTLLSFALADKINILKKEKDVAQAEALYTAQENARIIQGQNVLLEQKVIERTKELTETNNNLTVALNDLKQAQTQLVESEKMASLGQLTAGIAHEINNPINFVTSNVKPLQRDISELYALQEKTEQMVRDNNVSLANIDKLKQDIDYDYLKTEINYLLKGIHEGSSRTAEIVKGLRIFSRVDEDDIKLADINEGLESTIIIVNNQLNNKIAVEKSYEKLSLIECFPGKLNQVFLNLITNGIYAIKQKFGEEEGGVISIRTTSTEKDVTISISDNGTGMSEVTKSKLFEPFFTTKPVGEGTGLGLSIVYNTIKKHNGTITVDSAVGDGTTFSITIPKKYENG